MKVLPGDSKEMRQLIFRYKHDGRGLLFTTDTTTAVSEPDALAEKIDERLAAALANLEDGEEPSFH